jgi:hypothetical protein
MVERVQEHILVHPQIQWEEFQMVMHLQVEQVEPEPTQQMVARVANLEMMVDYIQEQDKVIFLLRVVEVAVPDLPVEMVLQIQRVEMVVMVYKTQYQELQHFMQEVVPVVHHKEVQVVVEPVVEVVEEHQQVILVVIRVEMVQQIQAEEGVVHLQEL